MKEHNSLLSSTHSLQISLKGVLDGTDGLDKHKQSLLDRVPTTNDWAKVTKESVSLLDVAFLSAKTQHEFALLSGKKNDILYHGDATNCIFDDDLVDMLISGKYRLCVHSHPDYSKIIASSDDRKFLKRIGQTESLIISWITGEVRSFTVNEFDI